MKVLILVDMINDFFPTGALPVPESEAIVPTTNQLMDEGQYDLRIAVNDAHPPGHVSFVTSHPGHNLYELVEDQVLWPEHCVPGTFGAKFHQDLRVDLIDRVIDKGTDPKIDSYSGFFDNKKERSTGLSELLAKLLAQRANPGESIEVDVVGLALDYCVKSTALDAKSLGYETRVVLDATRAVNVTPGDDVKAMRELVTAGVALITSRDILPEHGRDLAQSRPIDLGIRL